MSLKSFHLPFAAAMIFSVHPAGQSAHAQTSARNFVENSDDIIVVTGSRLFQTKLNILEIEADDISVAAPLSAVDKLRNLAGVSVIQPGGSGRAEVALRGAESNFTVVLIDGIRVNDPTNSRGGSFDFSTIAPSDIERIDVITGGYSGLYGSDALSGVINIITKGPGDSDAPTLSASTHVGDSGYWSSGGTLRLPGQISLTAARHESGSLSPGFSQKLSTLQAKAIHETKGWALAATARAAQSRSTGYPDASGGSVFALSDALEKTETDSFILGGSATRNISSQNSVVLTASLTRRRDNIDTPAILDDVQGRPAVTAQTQYDRAQVTAYGRTQISNRISGVLGADFVQETGRTVSETDFGFFSVAGEYDQKRTTVAGFGETQIELWRKASLTGGGRLDAVDGDVETSWQAELVQQTSGPTLSVRYANAFKAPSFYALSDALVGNPNLAAEESENIQVSLRQDWTDGYLSLGAFDTSFTNLVDFDFTSFQLVNRGKTRIRGLDSAAMWKLPSDTFRISGQISYAATQIDGEKRQLPGRPKWSGGLSTRWRPHAALDIKASSAWVGNRPGNSVPTGPRALKAYDRQDITFIFHAFDQLDITASISNVLDAEFEDAVGVPSPGANLRVGFNFNH